VRTIIFQMDGLPNSLRHGAPLMHQNSTIKQSDTFKFYTSDKRNNLAYFYQVLFLSIHSNIVFLGKTHSTLKVPLSIQVYKWVLANLLPGGNLAMDGKILLVTSCY